MIQAEVLVEPSERKVLVVEDEPHIREPLALLLREHGYEVAMAADGEEGLRAVVDDRFFLVISDISMPRMDGLTLLSHIKRTSPKTDVVMITGNVDEDFAISALKCGAYDYFRKPFDFRDLLRAVDRVVEKRSLERAAREYDLLRERTEAERTFAVESVQGLALAVEAKDVYTRGHSERVGGLAEDLSRWLDVPPDRIATIGRAGRLHDIGKIGIPDSILNKPEKLTPTEYDVIKQHPITGERIVRPISVLADVAPLIRWHHEWWDGTGYPDGLAGEEIPLEVRILSVVDVCDALRFDRAYRPGVPVDQILTFIGERSGSQFDPDVVQAFLDLARERPVVFP